MRMRGSFLRTTGIRRVLGQPACWPPMTGQTAHRFDVAIVGWAYVGLPTRCPHAGGQRVLGLESARPACGIREGPVDLLARTGAAGARWPTPRLPLDDTRGPGEHRPSGSGTTRSTPMQPGMGQCGGPQTVVRHARPGPDPDETSTKYVGCTHDCWSACAPRADGGRTCRGLRALSASTGTPAHRARARVVAGVTASARARVASLRGCAPRCKWCAAAGRPDDQAVREHVTAVISRWPTVPTEAHAGPDIAAVIDAPPPTDGFSRL